MTHSFPTRRSSDLPDAGRGGGEQHLALRSRRAARRARGPSHGGARMNGLFLIAEIGGRAVAISADQIESVVDIGVVTPRSEEHTSELQSLMRISYAVFCLKKKNETKSRNKTNNHKEQQYKEIIQSNTRKKH